MGPSSCGQARRDVVEFLKALGVSTARAPGKTVPEAIFEAPEEALIEFLQALFDADGCAVDDEAKGTRYMGLGSRSEELLLGVQELLASLGIFARIYQTGNEVRVVQRTHGRTARPASYGSDGPTFDLRISGRSITEFAAQIGFSIRYKNDRLMHIVDEHRTYRTSESVRMVSRTSQGFETTYNLTEPRNHSYIVSGVVVANCSEYMSLDNSSCNLASLNLLKFLRDDDTFDSELFAKCVELIITAMDISICFADFPTEAITKTTRDYRQLGIGYANLGALLLAMGLGYDSEGGRALAAAITSLMTGTSYKRSAELAAVVGPYAGYERNAEPHKRVMRKHAAANDAIRSVTDNDRDVRRAAAQGMGRGGQARRGARLPQRPGQCARAHRHDQLHDGLRTRRASSPTSRWSSSRSSSAAARCRSSTRRSRARCASSATPRRPSRRSSSTSPSTATSSMRPGLRLEHYEVFDTAMGERAIAPMGHVRMMAAAQPFVSGAISKTVNLPETATVEEIEDVYLQGWKLGLKALAVYRDNCKVGQPLSDGKAKWHGTASEAEVVKVIERTGAQAAAEGAAVADTVVHGRRCRGLHDRRLLPRRRSRRGVPQAGQAGLDAGRSDGRLLDGDLDLAAVRRSARDLRLEVHQHAVRAGRLDRRPGHPDEQVDHRLHLPPAGPGLPAVREARGARHLHRRRAPAPARHRLLRGDPSKRPRRCCPRPSR